MFDVVFHESPGKHMINIYFFVMDILFINWDHLRSSRRKSYEDDFKQHREIYKNPREITSS